MNPGSFWQTRVKCSFSFILDSTTLVSQNQGLNPSVRALLELTLKYEHTVLKGEKQEETVTPLYT